MTHMIATDSQFETSVSAIITFVQKTTEHAGRKNLVVGLSGGIDSSLSATLAVRALGPEHVFGLKMPYKTSSEASLQDATILANWLQIASTTIPVTPMVDAYFNERDGDQIQRGNKMARERMSILFDYAHRNHALVLGTGNRTEIALGYTTLHGDSACSLNPIGDLYKTEVRALSRFLKLPSSIIEKAPSADLWAGQTDEGEIGVTYEIIDQILAALLDEGVRSRRELDLRFPKDSVERVITLVNRHYYKRQLPPVASLAKAAIPSRIELSA